MWLLAENVLQTIQLAIANNTVSAEQQLEYEARNSFDPSGDTSDILQIVDGTAQINITGVMTDKPDIMALLFGQGNVTYAEIRHAIALAEQDPTVNKIRFSVDSPGGQINGLFDTLEALKATTKPTESIVLNQAASAGYALVANTDKIIASNKASSFGSIGVAVNVFNDPNRIAIASSKAPKKRPDVKTAEGQQIIREGLDPVHDLFVDSIAEGRNISSEKINAEFGQGAILLAEEALKRGMIDSIQGSQSTKTTPATGGKKQRTTAMDLKTLEAQHPHVYAAAVQVGVTQGVEQERERVEAHLISGEAHNNMKAAVAAIKDGSEMNSKMIATYLASAANAQQSDDADDDEAAVAEAAEAAAQAAKDKGSNVADMVEANLGQGGAE